MKKQQTLGLKVTNINHDSFADYVQEIERRALEANMTLIEKIDLDTSKIVLFWTHSPKIEVMVDVLFFQKDLEDERPPSVDLKFGSLGSNDD
jgi:hypothetical protein